MKYRFSKMSLLLGVTLCVHSLYAKKVNYTTLKPTEFKAQIEQTDLPYIIDIRKAADFALGRIKGSINIDSNDFQFISTVKQRCPNAEVIFIYCTLGKTSKIAAEKLADNGYIVINLKGGITAWRKKMPIVTDVSK